MTRRVSAGILLYRNNDGQTEVLLAHPGGPFFAKRDHGHWTVPKGVVADGDELIATAYREFEEETGHNLTDVSHRRDSVLIDLGSVIQASGKRVHCWAIEGDLDPARATSNTFEMPWPPGTGRMATFPEIDRLAWFSLSEARRHANRSQAEFIDRLAAALATG
jgi:predicted NUDIX family NTP pyrophosphohydrolase